MFQENVELVMSSIRETDRVLDIGGWAYPFYRADFVMDAMPFETAGTWYAYQSFPRQGGSAPRFSEQTWVQRDICDREPFPFPDKYFDFVVCSHTLEDIRDPLCVCSEMRRIGKAGYIEVPSRLAESSKGPEPTMPGIAG